MTAVSVHGADKKGLTCDGSVTSQGSMRDQEERGGAGPSSEP